MGEVGDTLRERRMALKVDVHEVEEATKIRAKYLRALENEEYNLLPGNAYIKSFLRTYADYLGLDSRSLVDTYRAKGGHFEEDVASTSISSNGVRSRRRLWIALAVLLALVVLVVLIVGALSGGSTGS
mgnify:CR=1 FL=1